jgi:H+/gluconate symporter-like permease
MLKNNTKLKLTHILLCILPIISLLIFFLLARYRNPIYQLIGMEDGILEWLQFVLFLFSSLLALLISYKLSKSNKVISFIYLILTLGLMFIALEEISWGQRIFNWETTQKFQEIGLIYLAICAYATLGWILLKINFKKVVKQFLEYFIIPSFLILYFLPLSINALHFLSFAPQDYEVTEFLMSLGFFIFFLFKYKTVKIESLENEK